MKKFLERTAPAAPEKSTWRSSKSSTADAKPDKPIERFIFYIIRPRNEKIASITRMLCQFRRPRDDDRKPDAGPRRFDDDRRGPPSEKPLGDWRSKPMKEDSRNDDDRMSDRFGFIYIICVHK